MKLLKYLFLFLVGFTYSQNVTVTTDKTTMSEAQTTTFTATLSATSSDIVTVNLTLGGTAKEDIDFTTAFTSKVGSTVAGGNGAGSELNKASGPQNAVKCFNL